MVLKSHAKITAFCFNGFRHVLQKDTDWPGGTIQPLFVMFQIQLKQSHVFF